MVKHIWTSIYGDRIYGKSYMGCHIWILIYGPIYGPLGSAKLLRSASCVNSGFSGSVPVDVLPLSMEAFLFLVFFFFFRLGAAAAGGDDGAAGDGGAGDGGAAGAVEAAVAS